MSPAIPSWPRPNFARGGGEPFLHFTALGRIDLDTPIDPPAYRAAGVPAGCQLLLYDRRRQPAYFRKMSQSRAWRLAAAEAPELAARAEVAPQCTWLRGTVRHSQTLDYLRDAVGIVQYLCDRGAEAVFDPQTLQFWSPTDW